jgi:peroxiredoxin
MHHAPIAIAARQFALAAFVGFLSAPVVYSTACAATSTDAGRADAGPGLLNPAEEQPGLRAGDRAPEGLLRDPEAQTVPLRDLYADQPIVLVFYRGGWCPYCTRDLRDWEAGIDEFKAAGARVIAVSMETADHALATARDNDLSYDVFVDETGDLTKAFRLGFALSDNTITRYEGFGIDLASRNASGEWVLPAPAVYVIDREGVIRYAEADWDYLQRAGYTDALETVRGL